ncbi:MAG: hypothetical protein AAF696_16970, partial [Bacteroidota bacterium]
FEPIVVNGYGIVGVCLIRLKDLRIKGTPKFIGLGSENAAFRMSVQWEENGKRKTGVYIPRRDTSSLLNTIAGGRVFPGLHHFSRFQVKEEFGRYNLNFHARDDIYFHIRAEDSMNFPLGSIFRSLSRASAFFKRGNIGYSPRYKREIFDGFQLHIPDWDIRPVRVSELESNFFENYCNFPRGSYFFDHALLMQNVAHEWSERGEILATRHSIRTLIQ